MTDLPPIDWFRNPELAELTPLTVTDDGRVYGHLCGWNTEHIGFQGQKINPPRSRTDYSYFHAGSAQVRDGDEVVEISVGKLTAGTGHASTGLDYRDTSSWYDNTGSIVAWACAGEDGQGVWIAGAVLPDVDEFTLRRFRSCGLSGDWRRIDGSLELVAALSVPVGGFPIPRARVASGAPLALVAAGTVQPPAARFGRRVAEGWKASARQEAAGAPIESVTVGKLSTGTLGARVEVNTEGVRFYPATGNGHRVEDLADAIAARLEQRRQAGELSARHAELLTQLDDTPDRAAALLAELDDSPQRAAELLAALDDDVDEAEVEEYISRMPPQLRESYLRGEVAARIRWGTPGDFTRCVAQARKHGMGRMAEGACANLHRAAVGYYPGDRRNRS